MSQRFAVTLVPMNSGPVLRKLVALLLLGAAPVVIAAGPNDACLKCHTDPEVKRESGPKMGLTDPDKFRMSVHGGKKGKCVECHEDAETADGKDHPKKLKAVDCASCHEDEVAEVTKTVHGKPVDGDKAASTCIGCHGSPHEILAKDDPKSLTNYVNMEAACGSCHGNDKVVAQRKLPGGNVQAAFHDSIHGRLVREGSDFKAQAPTCTTCHGAHSIQSKKEAGSKLSHANQPAMCGSCHQRALVTYNSGKHGQLQQGGDKTAPTCTDCHSAHGIQDAASDNWQVAAIGQCGNCHDDYVKSYHLTYHGKVTNLGYADMATCASCHGAHDIRPASDPISPVSAENRLTTCQQCHKDASLQLMSWDPHPRPADSERSLILYWANVGMNGLLLGVFAFFGLHTVLWAYRSFGDAIRRRRGGGSNR
jgi:hypothetical protein